MLFFLRPTRQNHIKNSVPVLQYGFIAVHNEGNISIFGP